METDTKYLKKDTIIIIMCTLPNKMTIVSTLIKTLLNCKLAACISTFKIHSFYCWNNNTENHHEIQLLIKTKNSFQEIIFHKIKELHPYKIPELLVLPILNAEKNYSSWINSVLQ